jgi:hypothetical protein
MNASSTPMPQETSPDSRLKGRPCPFEQQNIAGILEDVERRVRIMCRMMQLYQFDDRPSDDDVADLTIAMSVFYEYVDRQMDMLTALQQAIHEKGYVSLNMLGGRSDA